MGIRGILKKLDPKRSDSPSLSNPYAQEQQPTDPPPGYQEHDPRDRDQYIQQPPQKSYGGLPSGPRSGVHPGGVAPGYPARSASNGPPPQQYPSPGARPSQYGGSDYSPNSAGSTPVFPSNTSSPALGSAYPKEKYGAQDGVGGTRWEVPGASSYGNPAPLPSQRQGAYGNLDAQGGGSFAGYNRPPQPGVRTGLPQLDSSSSFSDAQQPMAKEGNEDTQVEAVKAETAYLRQETIASGQRTLANFDQVSEMMQNIKASLDRDNATIKSAIKSTRKTNEEAQVSGINLIELNDAANTSMFNPVSNSKKRIAKHNANRQNVRQFWSEEGQEDEEEDVNQQWEVEKQQRAAMANKSEGLLGATSTEAKRDRFGFEDTTFEDTDGTQAAAEMEIDGILNQIERKADEAKEDSEEINFKTEKSIQQLQRLDGLLDKAGDTLGKSDRYMKVNFKKH